MGLKKKSKKKGLFFKTHWKWDCCRWLANPKLVDELPSIQSRTKAIMGAGSLRPLRCSYSPVNQALSKILHIFQSDIQFQEMVPKFAHFTPDTLKLGMKQGICDQNRAKRCNDFKNNSIELPWTFYTKLWLFGSSVYRRSEYNILLERGGDLSTY